MIKAVAFSLDGEEHHVSQRENRTRYRAGDLLRAVP